MRSAMWCLSVHFRYVLKVYILIKYISIKTFFLLRLKCSNANELVFYSYMALFLITGGLVVFMGGYYFYDLL